MTLTINGEKREGIQSKTVADLVVELGLPGPACLIEHNGVALRRSEWELAVLRDGESLEMIRIVAGG